MFAGFEVEHELIDGDFFRGGISGQGEKLLALES